MEIFKKAKQFVKQPGAVVFRGQPLFSDFSSSTNQVDLTNYWMDCHEVLYRYSWFPEGKSQLLWC